MNNVVGVLYDKSDRRKNVNAAKLSPTQRWALVSRSDSKEYMAEDRLRGSKKFIAAVMEETTPIIEAIIKDKRSLEVMKNILFDEPGPRYMGLTPSPRDESLRKILFGFTEIDASFKVINDIPYYMKRFPPQSSDVSKTRFLNYHVANYFNEIYILRERLVAYQKVITRMYKKDRRLVEMGRQVQNLEILLSGFDGLVATRSKHVHEKRYDDDDFVRLNFFQTVNDKDNPLISSLLHKLYPLALKEYRKKWLKTISENNDSIQKILDIYFEILYGIVFDKNGKFVDPKSA